MSQVITNAFENYWQSCLTDEQPVVMDEFILADIPNLDITSPIDPETGLPPQSQIVHRQNVDQRGRINNNAVAYTIVMDTTVGDFSFNAMYLRNKQNGVIGMIVYKGRETKLKTDQTTGQTGNSLVKSMLMGYDQAAEATLTNVDAGTWQIDYAARLRGMDEDIRQLQADLYGHHTFVGDGFKVVEKDGAYQVSQGVAIIGGLRVELKAPEVIHPGTKPIGVWVDVHRAGSLLSEHQNHFTIITSVADLTDHVDNNGYQHYVAKLGTVQADSSIVDNRGNAGSGGGNSGAIQDTFALWKRSAAEAGLNLVDGSFEDGGVLKSNRDVLLHKSGGNIYSGSGPYPQVVDKGTNPNQDGSGFVLKSDRLLRDDLKTGLGLISVKASLSDVEKGLFSVGDIVDITERGGARFNVVAGESHDGALTVYAGEGKVAEMVIFNNEITSDALGMVEGMDVTDLLANIAKNIKSKNITSIKMNVNASFNGVLPYEYNRVAFGVNSLTGVGRLAINDKSNIIQALPNARSPYKVYTGKLNGMLLDNQNTKSAIEVRKEIRVVLLGDSIGVTSDWDSQAVPSGQRAIQGVDNFSTVNAFGFLLFQEICAAVGPGVRVKFYARCVGGKSYANLGAAWDSAALSAPWSGREQCTPGKAWVNCVLDLEPDLVIHEMGMNHGSTDYIDSFVGNWYSKLVETGRMGTFDQALVTTPSPNFEDAGQFGDFRQFCTQMFYVALQQRYVANKYGMSLIDVSFLSFLKRYGIDTRSCVMSKNYAQILVDGSSSVTIAAKSGKAFQHPNNPIFHQTTLTINQNAGADLDFRVNFGDGVVVQFGKTSISIITGFFSSMSTSKTVAYQMPDNTDATFTIQVLPHGVFVYAGNNGNTLLLVNDIATYTTTVDGVMQNSSATGTVTVKDIKVFEGEFPRYSSDTSTIEMYGVLDYTKNPFGGGINHPSSKGLAEIYLPPVREFCSRMTDGCHGQYVHNKIDMSNGDLIYIGSVEVIPYSVSDFWDDASLTYLRIKCGSAGDINVIDNRTGMTIYYNARGDVYAKISGGRTVRGMRFSGCWRKFGGWVVNSAHAPLRLVGFKEVAANSSTEIETAYNGKITRVDVVKVDNGGTYSYPVELAGFKVISARATISVESDSPVLAIVGDEVQVTSNNGGKLHYFCKFSSPAENMNRRIMFETSYIVDK